jgi:hypothetical protein
LDGTGDGSAASSAASSDDSAEAAGEAASEAAASVELAAAGLAEVASVAVDELEQPVSTSTAHIPNAAAVAERARTRDMWLLSGYRVSLRNHSRDKAHGRNTPMDLGVSEHGNPGRG